MRLSQSWGLVSGSSEKQYVWIVEIAGHGSVTGCFCMCRLSDMMGPIGTVMCLIVGSIHSLKCAGFICCLDGEPGEIQGHRRQISWNIWALLPPCPLLVLFISGTCFKKSNKGHYSVMMTCIGYFEKCCAVALEFFGWSRSSSGTSRVSLQVLMDSGFHSLVYVSSILCNAIALNILWYFIIGDMWICMDCPKYQNKTLMASFGLI